MELGCGDGRFAHNLQDYDFKVWGLDRMTPAGGTVADVVGDALLPPVAARSVDILVASNLVRHLTPFAADLDFVGRWLDLLKPGGALFIFEDEPCDHPPGAVNYRDLQEFLRRMMPASRGPLLPLAQFQERLGTRWSGAAWEFGRALNCSQLDPAVVVDLLRQGGRPKGEPGRLIRSITRDGLEPGFFWWARAGR